MRRGLILFAHGSRDPRWADPLEALALQAKVSSEAEPGLLVAMAFLEQQTPTLDEALDALAADCGVIEVFPVFWAANGHVKRDLPALVERARQRHPDVVITVLPVLSEVPGLLPHLARWLTYRRP